MPIDSAEKVITTYFPSVITEPFTWKGRTHNPYPLRVSPLLFRGFVCVEGCGGCCRHFTLDFLPQPLEPHPYKLTSRLLDFDGRKVEIFTDTNDGNIKGQPSPDPYYCRHLNQTNGRCGLHKNYPDRGYPFSCDFELLRFYVSRERKKATNLSHALFGRGWNMLRIDGERGAKCYMTEVKKGNEKDAVRKLKRLLTWCQHFGLKTVVPQIIAWAETGPHSQPLYLNQEVPVDESERKRHPLPLFGETGLAARLAGKC